MALEPITRQEKIIAGQDLTPITRMEKFLKEFGGGSGGGAQPDWNAADGEPGHILNRPFYESTEVLFDQRVELELLEGLMGITVPFPEPLEPGKTYRVTYNGVAYDCVANIGPSGELCYLGNASIMGLDDTGEPFVVLVVEEMGQAFGQIASINSDTSATVKIEKSVIHTIDPKYLPETGAGFNVNVWYENGEYVSNKTYEQIKAAEAAKTPITGTLTIADGKVFTLIGADSSAYAWVNLVAFDLNRTPSVYVYKVEIFENADVAVEIFSVSGTKVTNTDVYPK